LALKTIPAVKISELLKIQDGGLSPSSEIEKQQYLGHCLTDWRKM